MVAESASHAGDGAAPGEQKRLVRRAFEEVWNGRHLDAVDELYVRDFVFHSLAEPEPIRGAEGYKQFVGRIVGGFPDVRVTVEDIFGEGDRMTARLTMRMTHIGHYLGLLPTGRRLETTQIVVARIADGRIAESWQEVDTLGVQQQLGVVQPPGVGPLGLARWTAGTIVRFAVLELRSARAKRRRVPQATG